MSTSINIKNENIETNLANDFKNKNVIHDSIKTTTETDNNEINSVLSTRDSMNLLIDEMEALSKYK
jgi:hypothetical protein